MSRPVRLNAVCDLTRSTPRIPFQSRAPDADARMALSLTGEPRRHQSTLPGLCQSARMARTKRGVLENKPSPENPAILGHRRGELRSDGTGAPGCRATEKLTARQISTQRRPSTGVPRSRRHPCPGTASRLTHGTTPKLTLCNRIGRGVDPSLCGADQNAATCTASRGIPRGGSELRRDAECCAR